jgi:hypothetical protein
MDFYDSGHPQESGRFGGIAFRKDAAGRPWINTAFEGGSGRASGGSTKTSGGMK